MILIGLTSNCDSYTTFLLRRFQVSRSYIGYYYILSTEELSQLQRFVDYYKYLHD